jgi:hypothetical protein
VEDEVVRVAVVLLEGQLGDVVLLNLLNRVLEVVEGRVDGFGGLQRGGCELAATPQLFRLSYAAVPAPNRSIFPSTAEREGETDLSRRLDPSRTSLSR